MKRIVFVVAMLAGCGKADEALKALEGVKAAACGCKPTDVACAQAGLDKLAEWHTKNDAVMGARSQSAKATAHLEEIPTCHTSQALAAIPERAGCAKMDKAARAKHRWCKVAGWGGAEAVKPEKLPFGKKLTGETRNVTVGIEPAKDAAPASLAISGDAKAPTVNGVAMKASGAGWTWQDGEAAVELRKIDGGWMTLTIDGDTRRVAVLDE